MKILPLFIIVYEDGTKYQGGNSYFDSKWLLAPKNKKIKHIFFRLLDNNCLILQDFEKYNFMIEGTKDVLRVRGNNVTKLNEDIKPRIEYIYFMGLKEGKVTSYRITMFGKSGEDKFRVGDITRREYEFGKEWRGKSSSGWK